MKVHTLLFFAFWAFDKEPSKFISRSKPEQDQFDTSSSQSTQPSSQKQLKTTTSDVKKLVINVIKKIVITLAGNGQNVRSFCLMPSLCLKTSRRRCRRKWLS